MSFRDKTSIDNVKNCARAVMEAIKDYDNTTRVVTLEMLHALAIVNDTTYDAESHKQLALDSFGTELDGFVAAKMRGEAGLAS